MRTRGHLGLIRKRRIHFGSRAIEHVDNPDVVAVFVWVGSGQHIGKKRIEDARFIRLERRALALLGGVRPAHHGHDKTRHQYDESERAGDNDTSIAPRKLAKLVGRAGRPRGDRLIVEKAFEVGGKLVRGLVAARLVLFEAFADDGLEVGGIGIAR